MQTAPRWASVKDPLNAPGKFYLVWNTKTQKEFKTGQEPEVQDEAPCLHLIWRWVLVVGRDVGRMRFSSSGWRYMTERETPLPKFDSRYLVGWHHSVTGDGLKSREVKNIFQSSSCPALPPCLRVSLLMIFLQQVLEVPNNLAETPVHSAPVAPGAL